ncbi:MAG: aminotransferase class V-fold PLP-dependent enzyme [Acidobacteriota bacterium]|nr:aminotransferase class V-fold PLP-dependent enzyme [Acidobacteriota bacterium]
MNTNDSPSSLFHHPVSGEFDGVNPSISDSSTYSFPNAEAMEDVFQHEVEGRYLYSRLWSPSNRNLARTLSAMEGTEAALVTASGMAAITCTLLQLCGEGDEIVASRTIYGGTYAFLDNMAPRFGIQVRFVDINNLDEVDRAMTYATRVVYTESLSNPLLNVADIPALSRLAHGYGAKLLVDNTFSPLIFSPARLGADVVIYSLTKYINGASDCVAGAVCASKSMIASMTDCTRGTSMLLGPVLDSLRSASIRKNMYTLPLRMKQHSVNANFLARCISETGIHVHYPGLVYHPQHDLFASLANPGFGFGGMLVLDVETSARANALMEEMQRAEVGLLAVSLGYVRTLFSAPGHSTSSEIPEEDQQEMGLSEGMVRISAGIEPDIEDLWQRMRGCLARVGAISTLTPDSSK